MKKFLLVLLAVAITIGMIYGKTYTRKTDAADHQWETTSGWDLDDGTVPSTINDTAVFPVGVFPICTLTSNRVIACLIINDTIKLFNRYMTLQGGAGPMVVNNGAKFTNDLSALSFKPITSKVLWTLIGNYDFDGTGAFNVLSGATGLKDTITSLNYSGTNILNFYVGTAGRKISYYQVGTIITGGTFRAFSNMADTLNYYLCSSCTTSCNEFRYGGDNAGSVFTYTQLGVIICQNWYGDAYELGNSTFNGGGITYCSGDWSFSAAHNINMGTNLAVLNGSGAQVITSNDKLFYDIELDNSGSAISYPADSMTVTNDLTLTDGPWSFNGENHYVGGDFAWSTDDSLCLDGTLTVDGSFTFEGTGGFSFSGNLDQTGDGDFMWDVSSAANRIYGVIKQGAAGATTTWLVPGATNRYPIFMGGSQWQGSATGTIAGYINTYFIPDGGDTLWNFNGAVIDADSGEIEIHASDPGDIYVNAIDAANVDIDPRPYHSAGADSVRFHYLGAVKVKFFNGNTQSNCHGAHYLGSVDFVIGASGFRVSTNASSVHTLADRSGGTFVDTGNFAIGDKVDFNAGSGTYEIGGNLTIGDGDNDLETASWTLTGTTAATITTNENVFHIVEVNKTGNGVTTDGVLFCGSLLTLTDGTFTQTNATDTVYAPNAIINTSDAVTNIAPWSISNKLNIASGLTLSLPELIIGGTAGHPDTLQGIGGTATVSIPSLALSGETHLLNLIAALDSLSVSVGGCRFSTFQIQDYCKFEDTVVAFADTLYFQGSPAGDTARLWSAALGSGGAVPRLRIGLNAGKVFLPEDTVQSLTFTLDSGKAILNQTVGAHDVTINSTTDSAQVSKPIWISGDLTLAAGAKVKWLSGARFEFTEGATHNIRTNGVKMPITKYRGTCNRL
jgi:hypothetical protein